MSSPSHITGSAGSANHAHKRVRPNRFSSKDTVALFRKGSKYFWSKPWRINLPDNPMNFEKPA